MVTETETPETAAPAPPKAATPRGPNALSRFTIAGDVIARTAAKLPERERAAVKWLHGYCTSKNLSHRDVAPKLKQPSGEPYSHDSVYHMFVGNREPEQLANMVQAIERFRAVEEERSAQITTGFIETDVSRRVFRICRKALVRHRVAFIFGDTQVGKTAALEEYTRQHNHGETKMFRFPAGGGYVETLREMALVLDIPHRNAATDLRRRIIDCFDENMLLIADEIMESASVRNAESSKRWLKTVNFLREIHDRKKCGLVLCGTNVFREVLYTSNDARNLRQTVMRGLPPLQLPAVPSAADLECFAAAYGLGPAPDQDVQVRLTVVDERGREKPKTVTKNPLALQTQQIADNGLGRWITILQEASDLARSGRRPITWGAVVRAWFEFEQDGNAAEDTAKTEDGA